MLNCINPNFIARYIHRTLHIKDLRSNKLAFLLTVAGALRRVGRLALRPATTAKMHNLLLRRP
jgi:hypothetical protein